MPNSTTRPNTIRYAACARAWLATVALLWSNAGFSLEPEAIFQRVSPSVWIVRTLDSQEKPLATGSAVVVAPGKLITNCHVLAKARFIQVRKDNVSYAATLEFPDPERDLCQISIRNFTAPPVIAGSVHNLKIGQRTYAIGNPLGLELTMSEGIISSLRTDKDGASLIQTTAAISKGSSGGGLFDTEGRLIGITTFYAKDSQNLNFAIPVDWVAEVPERAAVALTRWAATASAPTTSPTAASSYPRILTGEEFTNHIRQLNRVRPKLPGVDWIEFSPRGNVNAMGPSTQAPSGLRVSGGYKLNSSNNTVCFDFFRTNLNSDSSAVYSLPGCYKLVQTAQQSYELQSVSEQYTIPYDLVR